MYTSLQELAHAEPWRRNFGGPRNALDPTWSPSKHDALCSGDITFDGTKWWGCKKCGYVGEGCITLHRPPRAPTTFFLHSALFYLSRRKEKVKPSRTVVHQMLYIAGVALRYAKVQQPDQLGPYLDRMVTK